jgi:hypothetical protein
VAAEYRKSGYRAALRKSVELQEELSKRIYIDPVYIAVPTPL